MGRRDRATTSQTPSASRSINISTTPPFWKPGWRPRAFTNGVWAGQGAGLATRTGRRIGGRGRKPGPPCSGTLAATKFPDEALSITTVARAFAFSPPPASPGARADPKRRRARELAAFDRQSGPADEPGRIGAEPAVRSDKRRRSHRWPLPAGGGHPDRLDPSGLIATIDELEARGLARAPSQREGPEAPCPLPD